MPLTTPPSAISAVGGPVSSGNAEIRPGVDGAWPGDIDGLSTRPTFSED